MALPYLPGNTFADLTQTKFHVSQTLGYKNGYILPTRPTVGLGGKPLKYNQLTEADLDELAKTKPTLTYGSGSKPAPVEFIPAHVAFDKKVLCFSAYFKQTVHESPNEYYRVRTVKIYYYLEDDSISVTEPPTENSGIPQGKFIKRQRLPKNDLGDCWHWKDLNLDIDVTFYGKVFHICNCDQWTAEFLTSEGIDVNPPVEVPADPYIESRKPIEHAYKTPSNWDDLKKFLELDRKVLRFYAVWDDRDSAFGELRPFVIHYYLVDDTIEVREVHQPNDGRDPFPVLICRQRLNKNRKDLPANFPTCVLETTKDEVKEWLTPKDFGIGKRTIIMGRKMLVYDCDEFTKAFYHHNFGVTDFTPVTVEAPKAKALEKVLPPYNGFGSLEDSQQSCLSLIPQPPKKDYIKMLENDGKILRYAAVLLPTHLNVLQHTKFSPKLLERVGLTSQQYTLTSYGIPAHTDSPKPEDENRKFIISYRLSDDMITIYEPPQRNAGILGGKFLERTRVAKPGSSIDNPVYYAPQDFVIGGIIEIFKHKFVLTDADEYVWKYAEEHADTFPKETFDSLKKIHGTTTSEGIEDKQ